MITQSNAEETLELALRASGLGTWDLDVSTGELNWSRRCKEIFGVPVDQPLRYTDFLDRLHPEERNRIDEVVQQALDPAGSGEYDIEYRVVRPDGEIRWAAARGEAIFEQVDGRKTAVRFIGTIQDITERRKSEEALLASERLAMTGRLIASIVHEINNPLEAVTNLLYLVRQEENSSHREQYVELAERELRRVSAITADTLRFNRDSPGTTTFDLCELVQSALSVFQGRFHSQDISVTATFEATPKVTGNQGQLRQVIVNLISNALDAMSRGGQLLVRCSPASAGTHYAKRYRLTFADTGHGISDEVRSRIFEAFYTTKGDAGSGIGLWLSLDILKRHGFALQVKSRVGQGTVFSILLDGA